MLPGRIYPTDLFRAWEGVFFSEEQCRYLGVWHANVHGLRSDGQTGLAIVGLWHVLCHWLLKAALSRRDGRRPAERTRLALHPRDRALGGRQRQAQHRAPRRLRGDAGRGARRRGLPRAARAAAAAKRIDARVWMWEAWWQGDPYLNVERLYRDTVFGARTNDDASYDRAVAECWPPPPSAPYVIVQATPRTPTVSSGCAPPTARTSRSSPPTKTSSTSSEARRRGPIPSARR